MKWEQLTFMERMGRWWLGKLTKGDRKRKMKTMLPMLMEKIAPEEFIEMMAQTIPEIMKECSKSTDSGLWEKVQGTTPKMIDEHLVRMTDVDGQRIMASCREIATRMGETTEEAVDT